MSERKIEEWVVHPDHGWTALEAIGDILGDNFITGKAAGKRIHIQYFRHEKDNAVMAKVMFDRGAQGPPGHAHGGSIASVLDETMGIAAWIAGHPVVAAELHVRFKKMAPLGDPLVVHTVIDGVNGKRIRVGARLSTLTGEVLAQGEGTFVSLSHSRMTDIIKDVPNRPARMPYAGDKEST